MHILMENLQAIKRAEMDLGETGIVQFTGNNSNGKSILCKVLQYWTNGGIKNKATRNVLIRDGEETGVLTMMHNKKSLILVIAMENKDTSVTYLDGDDEPITRSISDTGWENLIEKFGFRTYANGEVCLQISPTYGPIPFVTTSPATNGEIKNTICSDKIADSFIEAVDTYTWPALRLRKKELEGLIEGTEIVLNAVKNDVWRKIEPLLDDMEAYFKILANCKELNLRPIIVPPFDDIVPLPSLNITNIKMQYIYPSLNINPIGNTLQDYVTALNGVCPTCGRKFVDDHSECSSN